VWLGVLAVVLSYASAFVATGISRLRRGSPPPVEHVIKNRSYEGRIYSISTRGMIGHKLWTVLTMPEIHLPTEPIPPGDGPLDPRPFVPDWVHIPETPEDRTGPVKVGSAVTVRAGLPITCVRGGFEIASPNPPSFFGSLEVRAIETVFPLIPMPARFAANSAGYFGVLVAISMARRWRRLRKNRCPACGYDQSGTPDGAACPECGTAATVGTDKSG